MTWLAYSHLGVAKTVQLTTQPAVALAGIPFGVQPVGRLVDGSGVLSRATGVTVTASKAGGTGTLSGTLSVQTVEGVFTFTDLKMDTVTSAVTLSFASSGLTSATSSAFNVTQPNTIIGCEVGTYTTTGTDATFARTRVCQCVPGSYVVTGTNTGLNLNGLLGTVLLTETFADANFAARDWYSIVSQDWVASPAPSGFSGSLRMTWTSSGTVPSSGGMRKNFTATDSLYIRYQQAFSSNWVGSGQAYHPHLVMALSDQDDPYAGPSDNYLALYSEVVYSGGNQPAVKFQDNQYIDGAHIGSNISEARGTCGGNGQQGYADSWDGYSDVGLSNGYYASRNLLGAAQTSPGDTAWHTVEVEVILNTIVGGVGQLDGICRYWWDGNLIWERTNLIMRTGTRPNLKFNQFLFAPYIGDGSPVTQSTYIGDLTVGTSRTSPTPPTATAALSGTLTTGAYEDGIVTGGKTLVITLTNATWLAAGTAFDAQRQNVIDGIVSAQSETHGWNAERSNIPVSALVRTSATVATLTLPALSAYVVTANETLTGTVPATAQSSGEEIVATPTVTITEGTAPSGTGWLANLPGSYTNVITDYPFNDPIPASTGDAAVGDIWSTVFNGSGLTSRKADTTGGVSPTYVLENHYPAGHTSGTGVGQIFGSVSASVREFYVCMRVKFSAGYEWNTISNKFFIFEPDHIILESRHYGDYWAFDDQGLDIYSNSNIDTTPTPLDEWITVEFIVKRGNPGILKVWMNGVLRMDRTPAVSNSGGAQEVSINTTWGGGTGPMSTESWRWIDHVYIASP